ncbi:MAG: hypothetical protein EOP84_23880 [Verrucomicrobiaceae bacterium]|nr:MAG: hypothetical protein EOP84_23880 [Verrucomicrobiaceae bacterium]
MPDINSLSLSTRRDWPLPPQDNQLRLVCLEIAETFRWDIRSATAKLLKQTAAGFLFLAAGLLAYALLQNGDLGFATQSVWNFILSKVGLGLVFPDIKSSLLQDGSILETIVTFALDLLLGSWLIYLVACGWSWSVSRLFPVRWVKWAKVTKTTGSHNRAWRNRRRLAIIMDQNARCTPRKGDRGYGGYEPNFF